MQEISLSVISFLNDLELICLLTSIAIVYHIYPTPPLGQDMTQGQFLSGV